MSPLKAFGDFTHVNVATPISHHARIAAHEIITHSNTLSFHDAILPITIAITHMQPLGTCIHLSWSLVWHTLLQSDSIPRTCLFHHHNDVLLQLFYNLHVKYHLLHTTMRVGIFSTRLHMSKQLVEAGLPDFNLPFLSPLPPPFPLLRSSWRSLLPTYSAHVSHRGGFGYSMEVKTCSRKSKNASSCVEENM